MINVIGLRPGNTDYITKIDEILIPVSAQTKQGIPELWETIEQYL